MENVEFDFNDKTVIVTGASSGIGREIALEFGAADAAVLNVDIQENPKEKDFHAPTHEIIREAGGQAEFVEADISKPEQIRHAVEVAEEFGGVDVMVNNAGIYSVGSLQDLDPEEFDRVHDVNTKGVFYGCQAAAQSMIDRGKEGTIVNNASTESHLAERNQVHYTSSKGAVRMITRGAALELAEAGIRVNAVAPGHTDTTLGGSYVGSSQEAHDSGELLKPVPLGRVGHPDDVAPAVLFLASDAARYITGEMLFIDGGLRIY